MRWRSFLLSYRPAAREPVRGHNATCEPATLRPTRRQVGGGRETGTAITAEWDLTPTFTDSWLSSISVYAGVLLYCLHIMEEGAECVVRCLGTPANEISRSVTTSSILDFPRRTLTAVDWEEQTLNLKFLRWVSELWRRVYLHKYFEKKELIYQRN